MPIRAAALILVAGLAGCAGTPEPRPFVAPEVIEVPVTRYVPVPAELTEPCPVPAIKGRTVGDVVDAANARKLALDRCNAQLDAIRKAQPKQEAAP